MLGVRGDDAGQHHEAFSMHWESMQIRVEQLGHQHPDTILAIQHVGSSLFGLVRMHPIRFDSGCVSECDMGIPTNRAITRKLWQNWTRLGHLAESCFARPTPVWLNSWYVRHKHAPGRQEQ